MYIYFYFIGSCADIMHSAQPFRNGFEESVIALILRDIITGLDYLHSLGFVHRCVYSNVMVNVWALRWYVIYMYLTAEGNLTCSCSTEGHPRT